MSSPVHAPIYTEQRSCQDCYKCVRQCPVKAIEVVDSSAVVNHTYCIFCGKCTRVCPAQAKKIRTDLSRAREMVRRPGRAVLSLAPSFSAEFTDISEARLITALKSLGFWGISETALGAEIITEYVRNSPHSSLEISTACPCIVELVVKYLPHLIPTLSKTMSPLMAHAALLQHTYGPDTTIIFAGPCPAKKLEADRGDTAVDLALTFAELRLWLQDADTPEKDGTFVPRKAGCAALFPRDGGMMEVMKKSGSTRTMLSYSGIDSIYELLQEKNIANHDLFLELLSCPGGCINGTGSGIHKNALSRELAIIEQGKRPVGKTAPLPFPPLCEFPTQKNLLSPYFYEEEIRAVLESIGKYTGEDEINCSGCGYNLCRDFARACLMKKAETTMCVVFMRRQAEEKNDALLRTIPLAVVLVDEQQRIMECNSRFISLFGEIDFELTPSEIKRIYGTRADTFISGISLFANLFESDDTTREITRRINNRIYRIFLFQVHEYRQAGAIFQDITSPAVKAEEVISKTEEVIRKNVESVQTIASLLGENAAETQLMLNSIIETFTPQPDSESRHGTSLY
ncbi:MAG: [Fe-Fe] hydrogenase large subunit C-terminal domain-containing protein [Fibrobacterota bacterium]